jgi:hypothetical protein
MQGFTAVTAQQNTEHQISNSVKIGKQLMKSEFKKRIETLSEKYKDLDGSYEEWKKTFRNQLNIEIERQVNMSISNDSEVTRFRNLFTKFSRYNGDDEENFPKFKNNLDFLESFDASLLTRKLWLKESATKDCPVFQNFVKGKVFVNVYLNVLDNHNEDTDSDYITNMEKLGYGQNVVISQDTVDLYFVCVKVLDEANSVSSELSKVKYKLTNIDSVTEEMEAQLLIQELSKTKEGKAALEVTGNLVGNMLGTVPALLNLTNK